MVRLTGCVVRHRMIFFFAVQNVLSAPNLDHCIPATYHVIRPSFVQAVYKVQALWRLLTHFASVDCKKITQHP